LEQHGVTDLRVIDTSRSPIERRATKTPLERPFLAHIEAELCDLAKYFGLPELDDEAREFLKVVSLTSPAARKDLASVRRIQPQEARERAEREYKEDLLLERADYLKERSAAFYKTLGEAGEWWCLRERDEIQRLRRGTGAWLALTAFASLARVKKGAADNDPSAQLAGHAVSLGVWWEKLRTKAIWEAYSLTGHRTSQQRAEALKKGNEVRWQDRRVKVDRIKMLAAQLRSDDPDEFGGRKARADAVATRLGLPYPEVHRILVRHKV
jgi:hypothetical protein